MDNEKLQIDKCNRIQISKNIKAERVRAGLSLDDVAIKLNITQRQYSNYEADHRIDSLILFKLSKIFNCNINAFFVKVNSTESKNGEN